MVKDLNDLFNSGVKVLAVGIGQADIEEMRQAVTDGSTQNILYTPDASQLDSLHNRLAEMLCSIGKIRDVRGTTAQTCCFIVWRTWWRVSFYDADYKAHSNSQKATCKRNKTFFCCFCLGRSTSRPLSRSVSSGETDTKAFSLFSCIPNFLVSKLHLSFSF